MVTPAQADLGGATVKLPKQVGEWVRPDAARRIGADTIFDYMDGAGELYLAYRFDHLDVFEYKAADASLGTVLVEVYSMKTPDDAFGLLSNDWGGEPVPFDPGPGQHQSRAVPDRRALYGAGLLRMAVKDRYVRILASRETNESKEAVLRIGREIVTPGAGLFPDALPAAPPAFLKSFDDEVDPKRPVRPDRTCFFRSHLVLNSAYFLASQDILSLGPDVTAATTEYAGAAPGEHAVRVIVARYPSGERARTALDSFAKAYLGEAARRPVAAKGAEHVEHGWVAWSLWSGGRLTIVLDAPDRAVARTFADAVTPYNGDGW